MTILRTFPASLALAALTACASGHRFHDPDMDFGSVKTVAVLPLANFTREAVAADRVRDVFSSMLLATGALYVLPQGEVLHGVGRAGVASPATPSVEEVTKLGAALKVDAIITGVVREYGELHSGSSAGNVVSLSLQMHETASGKVVWSASSTRGGVGFRERMLGGGGEPMNAVTEAVVRDMLEKLFRDEK